jgi:hypothetical protein
MEVSFHMKTYPLRRQDGSLLAFEITSAWVTFRPLYGILRSVQGVTDVKRNWFKDDRVTFKFHGEPFVINEPWGDNSRYWLGPENAEASTRDITSLHDAFQRYEGLISQTWKWVFNAKST